jgi:hypothetical protein
MSFNHFNRRLHVYLAMALLPWVFMYGLSAVPFTRHAYFDGLYDDGVPMWTTRFEQAYERAVPTDKTPESMQAFGQAVVRDLLPGEGNNRSLGAYSPNVRRVNVYLVDFWDHTRITYRADRKTARVEDKRFRWDHFVTTLHARGGYHQDTFLNDAWAFIVDLVSVAFVLWVASGILMWWQLKQTRFLGALALGGGLLSFVCFLLVL